MKLITIGDSITKGTYTANGDEAPLSIADPNFSTLLKEKLNAEELINYGLNGISYCSLTNTLPEYAVTKRVQDFSLGDLFILAAGTNDFGTGVPLGNENDTGDISFFGAVDLVFNTLKEKNPDAAFFVVTPIPRIDAAKNSIGLPLDAYRDALTVRAKKYGFFIVDGRTLPIDPHDRAQREAYIYDGLHPNSKGHALYAEWLWKHIKKQMHV